MVGKKVCGLLGWYVERLVGSLVVNLSGLLLGWLAA